MSPLAAVGRMNVLVTGGTGSIGAWVVRELFERGHEPVAFDVAPTLTYVSDLADDVSIVQGDVTDYEAVRAAVDDHDVERVVHLAKLLPKRSETDPLETLRVNVLGSGNVLEAARESGVRRVVFSSSKSVFADVTGRHGPPEFEPLPVDYPKFDLDAGSDVPFYTLTNKMVEYFGVRYAAERDLQFVVLRFGSTWGPGKNEIQREFAEETRSVGGSLVCELVDRAMAGEPVTVSETQTKADNATYTKDVAAGVVDAALSDDVAVRDNPREFLVDGGRTISHEEFGAVLEDRFPSFEFTVQPTAGSDEPHRKNVACRFDLSRTRAELGYEPAFGDPAAAVEDYVETVSRYR